MLRGLPTALMLEVAGLPHLHGSPSLQPHSQLGLHGQKDLICLRPIFEGLPDGLSDGAADLLTSRGGRVHCFILAGRVHWGGLL
jgi:hypothetical protein